MSIKNKIKNEIFKLKDLVRIGLAPTYFYPYRVKNQDIRSSKRKFGY